MNNFLLQLLPALSGASTLFLTAAGLTLIFGVTRIVNFAHGSFAMLGAYIGYTVLTHLPRTPAAWAIGALGTAAIVAALGTLVELTILRRIYRAPELFQLLATFALVLIIADATQAIWGPADLPLPRPPWLRTTLTVANTRTPAYDLFLILLAPLTLAALTLALRRTRWGTLTRAATADREMVGALGVDSRWLFTSVFAAGSALAGLGGVLSLPDTSATPAMDLTLAVDAFAVVIIGGLGSLPGAFLASLLLATGRALGILLLPGATLVLPFALMLAVLAGRPHGLLGRPPTLARPAAHPTLLRPAPPVLGLAALALLAAFASLPFWANAFLLGVAAEALVAVLFAASLHLLMGPGGMPSFGHAAWFGIGAYAAALSTRFLSLPLPTVLLAAPLLGTLTAGLAAAAFGLFVARLSGIYLAMLTLAAAQLVWATASTWTTLTGGDNGLLDLAPALSPATLYWLTLATSTAATLLLRRLVHAPAGYALRAARDSAPRAAAVGLPVTALRIAATAAAGAAAGLAGATFALGKNAVFPTYVSLSRSVDVLLAVLLGGVDTVSGPVVGALAYTGLVDTLLRVTEWWRLVLGLAVLALVLLFPEGIAGATQAWWTRRAGPRHADR